MCNQLSEYKPELCGTIPLGIDVSTSDLDIIMEVKDLTSFEDKIKLLYSDQPYFKINRKIIRGKHVVKANFVYKGFEFELFGQDVPVHEQYAYLHMVIEKKILLKNPELKPKMISLKQRGYKTEPAFCKVLGIAGDPYEALIQYGKDQSYI
ncbi:DUF4269 domain-containing protein [Piscibacillus salipiscarius]|uniref:DUF4269 domain-containing protein n=1 Tax=Piscibacillus salipiscarius TaxID=299480 RepID=UPI0006D10696|nr:DUF4269 domain-containing protein [Piscibacillus salipiscarius]